VIVQMPTKAQASKVAKLTGGTVLSDKNAKATTKVKVEDFESHRSVIEGISVLFKLFTDDGTKVPSGWMVTGATFEVEWPKEQERQLFIWSHFGARRFAKNWAIEQVKADLDVKKKNPHHASVPWTLGDLRKRWNQVKDEVAPWWAEN